MLSASAQITNGTENTYFVFPYTNIISFINVSIDAHRTNSSQDDPSGNVPVKRGSGKMYREVRVP
jgi:hypothetical protein